MKKVFCIILFLLSLASCSKKEPDSIQQIDPVQPADQNSVEETNKTSKNGVFEEFSVLITVATINVRTNPSTSNKENIIDKVHMGETYTVFEETNDKDYTWYRIGNDRWIADDGTWCVKYGATEDVDYPYLLDNKEKEDILLSLETGGWFLGSQNDYASFYITMMKDAEKFFDCNILFEIQKKNELANKSVYDSYRYIINNIVRTGDNDYDLYIKPVENENCEDHSTGILRITDIGKQAVGDGSVEALCFDMTFIQNHNDVADEDLKLLYGLKHHYTLSQMAI